jgi:hypothetical protein
MPVCHALSIYTTCSFINEKSCSLVYLVSDSLLSEALQLEQIVVMNVLKAAIPICSSIFFLLVFLNVPIL